MIIVYEQSIPHYRVHVYNRLSEIVDCLEVVYSDTKPNSDLRSISNKDLRCKNTKVCSKWFFKNRFYLQGLSRVALRRRPSVVIIKSAVRNISFYPLLLYYKLCDIPVIVWGHGISKNRKFYPKGNIKDWPHYFFIQSSDAFICYTDRVRQRLSQYTTSDKLFVARNTINTNRYLQHRLKLEKVGKKSIKRKLNIKTEHNILFIGRLMDRKKVDVLIRAYKDIKRRVDSVGLIIIGSGSRKVYLKQLCRELRLENVRFTGAKYGREAGEYLYASDVMVIPGGAGLSVNHAFSYGLPVITQYSGGKKPMSGHGPEASYVEYCKAGFFSKPGHESLAKKIESVLISDKNYCKYAKEFAGEQLSNEQMMEGFKNALSFVS